MPKHMHIFVSPKLLPQLFAFLISKNKSSRATFLLWDEEDR